jgi:S1-C subfamily serine protease
MSTALLELSNGFANAVELAGRSVISVNEGGRAGVSGTIWRDGLAVTAEHTIRDQDEVTIELPTGGSSSATVVGRDPSTDLALLRLKDTVPAAADLFRTGQLRVGNFVLAIGRRGKDGLAASHGIVSALSGAWRTWQGGRIDQWLRLDLVPFTGFSGGPLVDTEGKVIGINTSGPRRSVMTIPAATVNRIVDQLLSKGRIGRGFLGLALQPVKLPNPPRSSAGTGGGGLLVIMIEPGSPAEKGGMMIGDIVLAIGDKPLADTMALQAELDPEEIGKTLKVRVLRGGQPQDLSVVVGERPE